MGEINIKPWTRWMCFICHQQIKSVQEKKNSKRTWKTIYKKKVTTCMVNKETAYSKESKDVCSSSNPHTHYSTQPGRKKRRASHQICAYLFQIDLTYKTNKASKSQTSGILHQLTLGYTKLKLARRTIELLKIVKNFSNLICQVICRKYRIIGANRSSS